MTSRVWCASSIQKTSPGPPFLPLERTKDYPPVLVPPAPERTFLVLSIALVSQCSPLFLVACASFFSASPLRFHPNVTSHPSEGVRTQRARAPAGAVPRLLLCSSLVPPGPSQARGRRRQQGGGGRSTRTAARCACGVERTAVCEHDGRAVSVGRLGDLTGLSGEPLQLR
jgi:hypothetical protein